MVDRVHAVLEFIHETFMGNDMVLKMFKPNINCDSKPYYSVTKNEENICPERQKTNPNRKKKENANVKNIFFM